MEKVKTSRGTFRPGSIIKYTVLVIIVLVFIFPIIWLFVNSLKTNTEIFTSPWALPSTPQLKNYVDAWTAGNIGRYFLNSIIVTAITLFFSITFSSMAAYAISRMKWKLSNATLVFFLLGMMIPIHATLIPLFLSFTKLGLTNNYVGLILPYITFSFPSSILIMSGFFSSIPREMEEAAVIDGSSIFRAFVLIILPMSQPALITVLIFNFISTWNELLVAVVFISDSIQYTLPVGLTNFIGIYSTNYAPMLAAMMLSILPTIIIYSVFNTKIVSGITAGAIKS